jgi:hypothetical protein
VGNRRKTLMVEKRNLSIENVLSTEISGFLVLDTISHRDLFALYIGLIKRGKENL